MFNYRSVAILPAVLSVALLFTGCKKAQQQAGPNDDDGTVTAATLKVVDGGAPSPDLTADQVLEQMVSAYAKASSYEDSGVMRHRYMLDGERREDSVPFQIKFARPNRFYLRVNRVTAASDGQAFRAKIDNQETNHHDQQFVERKAPEKLSLADLESDSILNAHLSTTLYPIQLDLLLGDSPLKTLRAPQVQRERLEDGTLRGQSMYRVRFMQQGASLVFWIDANQFLLHRIELPPQHAQQVPEARDVELWADLQEAKFDWKPEASDLALSAPADAKKVRYFIDLPLELPSELYGKQLTNYRFTSLDGQELSPQTWGNQIIVMTWFREHPKCQLALQQLAGLRKHFAGDKRIGFLAVCSDPVEVTPNDRLLQITQSWGVQMPLARDTEGYGNSVFKVTELPTVVILDGTGVVHIYDNDYAHGVDQHLVTILQRLVAGENIAHEILKQVAYDRERYRREVEYGSPPMALRPQLAAASQPQRVKLAEAWTNTSIQAPGNVSVIENQGSSQFLVHAGTHQLHLLDANGKELKKVQLPKTPGTAFAHSDVYRSPSGQTYIATGVTGGAQAVVLNEKLEVVLTYPEKPIAPINDFKVADTNGDGVPELLVAFAADVGLHCVNLQGRPLWTNRFRHEAFTITVGQTNNASQAILASGAQGNIFVLSGQGQRLPEVLVPERTIIRVLSLPGGGSTPYATLTYGNKMQMQLLTMDSNLKILWEHDLTEGSYMSQIQPITSGDLLGRGQHQWIIAGPDGTVDIVAQDADFYDSFAIGDYLTGVAGSQGTLVVSTPKKITAYRVTP